MTNLSEMFDEMTRKEHRGSATCNCGLFARFVSERHYFNGEFDCYSYTVDCKRCGIETVECV